MNQEDGNYTIILRGRFAGKDRAVAKALSEVFGLSDAWGLQVVGGSPITLLAYMNANQAQAVYNQLLGVEAAGCRFLVQEGLDRSIPAVSWSDDPLVAGKPLSEYLNATVAAAPVMPAAGATPQAPAAGGALLVCPHCGKPVAMQRGPGGPKLVPAALGPAPIPVPKPGGAALPAPVPIPVPGAQPPKQATPRAPARPVATGGAKPPQAPKPVPAPAVPPAAPAVPRQLPVGPPDPPAPTFEPLDIDGLEELAPGAESRVPLPDVPVVESDLQPLTFPKAAKAPSGSDPRLNAPITLEDFEAGLGEFEPQDSETDLPSPEDVAGAVDVEQGADQDVRQVRPSGRGRKASGGVPMGASAGTLDRVQKEDPDALCSIFIGRNNNPQVHELIAEIQGITVEEAQRMCQKVIVPVVKDIPVSEADAIRERFREVNVNPRVTLKR